MLQNNPELKSKIDQLWNKFWSGGISNPLTAIEQITYLLFMKRLDELDQKRQADAEWTGEKYTSKFEGFWIPPEYRARREEKDTDAEAHLTEVLAYAASTLMQIADMLEPFMPGTATAMNDLFKTGVVPEQSDPLFPKKYLHTKDPRAGTSDKK